MNISSPVFVVESDDDDEVKQSMHQSKRRRCKSNHANHSIIIYI